MVRAGAVTHPSQRAFGGYSGIQKPRERYSITDHRALMDLLGIPSIEALRRSHKDLVEEALARTEQVRQSNWTHNVAVGSRDFVEIIKEEPGMKAKGRRIS
jgi:hypothetical protein